MRHKHRGAWFVLAFAGSITLVQFRRMCHSRELHAHAFGFDAAGDVRSQDVRCLGTSRDVEGARAIAGLHGYTTVTEVSQCA